MLLGILLVLSLSSCIAGAAAPTPALTSTPYAGFSIVMSRGGGLHVARSLNALPPYTLSVDGNGHVGYEGKGGIKTKELTRQEVDQLIAAVRDANVWSLRDSYLSAIDFPSIYLTISLDGKSKDIRHQGSLDCDPASDNAPPVLCKLEQEIERIVSVID